MPEDVVGQVRDLMALALAGDGSSSESRNAAVKACRLIQLHKLEIALPSTAPASPPGDHPWRPATAPAVRFATDVAKVFVDSGLAREALEALSPRRRRGR